MRAIVRFALVLLGIAAVAHAEDLQIAIETTGLNTITYEGRNLYAAEVLIPEAVASKTLMSAILEIKFGPGEEAEKARTEVQVSAWLDGRPSVPEGRFRPISLSISSDEAEEVHIDISDILEPIFSGGEETSVQLVFGRILDWDEDLNAPLVSALHPENDVWAILHVTLK